MSNPIDFVRDFIRYVDSHGIYDEFDRDTQKMVTSVGVQSLIKDAHNCLPEKLKPREAAARMRDLSEAERDKLLEDADKERVVDMRKHFQKKMSENGGAQGIIQRLVNALETNDGQSAASALTDARALVFGPENVENISDPN